MTQQGTAKTDWVPANAVSSADLNRIEQAIKDSLPKDGSEGAIGFSAIGYSLPNSTNPTADTTGIVADSFYIANVGNKTGYPQNYGVVYGWNGYGSKSYAWQMFFGDNLNELYFRRGLSNNTWSTWFKTWHSGNDGQESGLDADMLRGFVPYYPNVGASIVAREPSGNINASSYNGYIPLNKAGDQMIGLFRTGLSTGRISDLTGAPAIEVNSDAASSAYLVFHRNGAFAAYFGMDTDNLLKFGGWSFGNVAYKVWTEQLLRNNGNGTLEWNDNGTWKAVGGVKNVQRGVMTHTTSGAVNLTIGAVNASKSFVNISYSGASGTMNSGENVRAQLTSSTNLEIFKNHTAASNVSWEVIESY